jgi:hypothetical protein
MKNKKRNIIIWLMTWAVLFLVVAYSPIGRPDLYVGNSYYISSSNQGGVNFKNGIVNAPKGASLASAQDEDIETPTYTPDEGSSSSYTGDASEYTPQNAVNGTSVETNSTKGITPAHGAGGTLAYSSSSRGSQAQGTSTAQNDVSSLSSNLTLTSNTNSLQAAPAASSNGGHHPGGHNPKNPPIPVGDGVWLLLVMVGIYSFWRKQQATKANTTVHR